MMADLMVMEPFGKIPRWAAMPPKLSYLGYFANGLSARWFFLAEPGRMRLCGSDSDWEVVHEHEPSPEDIERYDAAQEFSWPPEAPMNRDEKLWLAACLAAAVDVLRAPRPLPPLVVTRAGKR